MENAIAQEQDQEQEGRSFFSHMTATYSPDDNKLRLTAVSRLGDALYARVKAAGFQWAPKQECFYAVWTPGREDLLLELCGEIGDDDKTLAERAEERAERFDQYSENRARDAASAKRAVDAIADGIPLGQPILVGHHSERHARKHAEKIENGMRKAVKMWETSAYWTRRAAGALAHADYKERPDVRARRIKVIEADVRKLDRADKEGATKLKLWGLIDQPEKWKAGGPATREERAAYIADRVRLQVKRDDEGNTWSAYDVLRLPAEDRRKGAPTVTIDEVIAAAHRAVERSLAYSARWRAHYNNRLAYERAMLGESGYVEPPKPATRAALPLLNYGGTVQYRCRYHRDIKTTEAHGMTAAEFAAINKDYKGTFTSADGTHRVRSAVLKGHNLCVVYLTDKKQHPKPGSAAAETREQTEVEARVNAGQERIERAAAARADAIARNKKAIDKHKTTSQAKPESPPPELAAMKETLKHGVQIAVAPELFPTPQDIAEDMVQRACISPGSRVLEPSAGTGILLGAMGGSMFAYTPERVGEAVAVEINYKLCDGLRADYPLTKVHCADFLECWADTLGTFDAIVMNPPFANQADIKHVLHAHKLLKPDGRIVAIMSAGVMFRQDKLAAGFRELVEGKGGYFEELPDGSFKDAGTMVRTVLVVLPA